MRLRAHLLCRTDAHGDFSLDDSGTEAPRALLAVPARSPGGMLPDY